MSAPGPAIPVRYDHREDASGLPELLREAGVPLEAAQLPVGDYVVSERICVERKARGDLAASIRDGRLFEQAERLLAACPPVLVIEDPPVDPLPEAWRGAVCKLVEQGVTVLQTRGVEDTAAWIARLAKRARRDPSQVGLLPTGMRRSPAGALAQAEMMLSCVHGMSPATSGVCCVTSARWRRWPGRTSASCRTSAGSARGAPGRCGRRSTGRLLREAGLCPPGHARVVPVRWPV